MNYLSDGSARFVRVTLLPLLALAMLLAGCGSGLSSAVQEAAPSGTIVPVISWSMPTPISSGTALSAAQLNATATIPGTFSYSPVAGTILAAGTTTLSVTFTPADTSTYSTASKSVSLLVNGGPSSTPGLNWATPSAITYGTPLSSAQLNATSAVPGLFVYSPAVGETLKAGSQTLNVTFTPADTTSPTQTASVTLMVTRAAPILTWATPAPVSSGTILTAAQLNATASVPGSFVYSPAIGSSVSSGTNTLTTTFTPTDSTDYSSATKSIALAVDTVTGGLIWATPSVITYGTALSQTQLNATASIPGTFAYSPSAGTTLPAGNQTLHVTFTPADTTRPTQTASVGLLVNKATPMLNWATPAAIASGTPLSTAQLNATASVRGSFVYSPAAGTTLAAGTSTLSVSFSPTDTANFAMATKSVSLQIATSADGLSWATPAAIAYGTPLSSAQLNATASISGSFVYSPAAGTTLAAGIQTLNVKFNPADPTRPIQTASVVVVVTKATPVLTWATPAAITAGTALSSVQLNATATVPGTFLYSPAAGAILAAGNNTLSATFTPNDSSNYANATKSVSLAVNAGSGGLVWATPAAITYGTTLSSAQLNASSSLSGTFVYSPSAGTTLAAGSQTLKVTFTPTEAKSPVQTASVILVVAKATPVITWPTPASILSGVILSIAQLDATASVPGKFVYTPAAGVLLSSGTNLLSTVFTPTDTANYTIATASVGISVGGGSSASTTDIAIGSTVQQTGIKRLGINIDSQDFYDSDQQLRNLVFMNPGFEGQMWQSIIRCATVTATSCTDTNGSIQWPTNFLQGATFEFIYGKATGETGTVTASTTSGPTISFAQLAQSPAVGDYMVVRNVTPGDAQAGWWTFVSGGGALSTELSDLSANTQGSQALRMTAAGSGQSAQVISYFDSVANRSFVQLRGAYQITFRAKGAGGNNQLAVSFTRATSGAPETFINQTISLSNSWSDYTLNFTAAEDGTKIGTAGLSFKASGADVLLDDVSLSPATTTSANPTSYRDEVVSALVALHPGVLRYNDGANMGSTLDNSIAPALARQRAGASEYISAANNVAMGLHEFLQLCATVGAEPYYNMPAGMSVTEMKNLIEYFAGDASTPYGAKRAARGQIAPWTSIFPIIHLELGNEEWNTIFPGIMMSDSVAYGNRAEAIFTAAKSSPSYVASSFDLVMGSFAFNLAVTSTEITNSSSYDSISLAPYLFYNLSNISSNEAIFGSMFAEPESLDSVSGGYMNQQAKLAKSAGKNVAIYEVNLSTLSGTASQAMVNAVVPSVAAGLTVANHMLLMMRDLGIKTQNIWALGEYTNQFNNTAGGGPETSPLFGAVVDMGGQSNLRRPIFLAEQLTNSAILSTMLSTTLTGANPTWDQSLINAITLSGAHDLQTFAFTDGANSRSLIVFNLSRTNALPVTFSGPNAPTGTVTLGQLSSANLTDTNETSATVNIVNTTIDNFEPSTPYSLPPFSMSVFSWKQ